MLHTNCKIFGNIYINWSIRAVGTDLASKIYIILNRSSRLYFGLAVLQTQGQSCFTLYTTLKWSAIFWTWFFWAALVTIGICASVLQGSSTFSSFTLHFELCCVKVKQHYQGWILRSRVVTTHSGRTGMEGSQSLHSIDPILDPFLNDLRRRRPPRRWGFVSSTASTMIFFPPRLLLLLLNSATIQW